MSSRFLTRTGALALALTLAGCSDSIAPLNVSPEQLESIGEWVAAEVEGGVMQLTAQDVMDNVAAPTLSVQSSATTRFRPAYLLQGAARGQAGSRIAINECGVFSPNPPTDTDGDQVPDNLTVTFALPACHIATETGSTDLTGILRVSDPAPGTAGMALSVSLDDFRLTFSGIEGSGWVRRDGSASVAASETGLSQLVDWTDLAQLSGFPSVGADINWSATFAAAPGQTITVGQPLPDGVYQPNGSLEYRVGRSAAAFTLTTLTALQYSAECAAGIAQGTADSPFTAGKVRVTVRSQEGAGAAEVTYAGCGMASVLFVRL